MVDCIFCGKMHVKKKKNVPLGAKPVPYVMGKTTLRPSALKEEDNKSTSKSKQWSASMTKSMARKTTMNIF